MTNYLFIADYKIYNRVMKVMDQGVKDKKIYILLITQTSN